MRPVTRAQLPTIRRLHHGYVLLLLNGLHLRGVDPDPWTASSMWRSWSAWSWGRTAAAVAGGCT